MNQIDATGLSPEDKATLLLLVPLAHLAMDDSSASAEDGPRFGLIASDHYGHCFVGSNESTTRWVADVALLALGSDSAIRAAQVLAQGRWVDMDAGEMKDLLEDIRDNAVLDDPEEHGAYRQDDMPTWVPGALEAQKLSPFTVVGRKVSVVHIEFDSNPGLDQRAIKKAVQAAQILCGLEKTSIACQDAGSVTATFNPGDDVDSVAAGWLASASALREAFVGSKPSPMSSRERGG